MHILELERFAVLHGRLVDPLELPDRDVGELLVDAPRFPVFRLILLTEMAAARFLADQRVTRNQLGELEEVGYPPGALQALVESLSLTGHAHLAPELLPETGELLQRPLQPGAIAAHPHVVPHESAELAMEVIDGSLPAHREEPFRARAHLLFHLRELGAIGGNGAQRLAREIVADGVREDEVP